MQEPAEQVIGTPQQLPHGIIFNNHSSSDDKLLYFFHPYVAHLGHELTAHTKQKNHIILTENLGCFQMSKPHLNPLPEMSVG